MLNNRSLSSFKSQSFACDRFDSDYDYATNSSSLFAGRPSHHGLGRLYSASSFERLNSSHPPRRHFHEHLSTYDLPISSNYLSSSPTSYRSLPQYSSTNFTWRRSGSMEGLLSPPIMSPPKLGKSTFAHSSILDKTYSSQPLSMGSSCDSSPIIEKRNMLVNNFGSNYYSSGLPPSPNLPQRFNKSRPNFTAPRSPRTLHNTFYRPPIRERPVLTSILTSLQTKPVQHKPKSNLNSSGICRFRHVIKFREHNIGYPATERKASISWDLPSPVSKKPIATEIQSSSNSGMTVTETNKHISGNETHKENGGESELKVKCEELREEIKKEKSESLNVRLEENQKCKKLEKLKSNCVTNSEVGGEKKKRTQQLNTKCDSRESLKTVEIKKDAEEKKPKLRFKKYFIEDFDFIGVLGRGSFGKVFLVQLKASDLTFALKCLKKHSVIEDDDVDSAMIERRMLALGSQSPFICKLFCTFQSKTHLNFVMEYLCGGDLMFHVQKFGKFSEERTRFYSSEIVCALKFLHKKYIIYRDLKLDNILLDSYGHIRLVDFGMCQCRTYREECLPSNFCGTPHYMAPEIIQGSQYNQSVDWWSFGILLYEMLVGQSPFNGTDEDELLWNVCYEKLIYPLFLSAVSKDLISLLLERTPEKRLGSENCSHGDVANHRFFNGVNWDDVNTLKITPPFVPKIEHPTDISNFDTEFTQTEAKLTPVDDSIIEKLDHDLFKGFSYTNPHLTD